MALTATAQSALLPTPSWDETIVPALRKRLESESLVLAKRISAASITSAEDNSNGSQLHYAPSTSSSHHANQRAPANGSTYSPRPSGIPRPSLGGGRPSITDARPPSPANARAVNGAPSKQSSTRSRTLSQPKLIDRDFAAAAAARKTPPMPAADLRSASPITSGRANDIKPTRIPVARTRTGSTSSYGQAQGQRSESRANGQYATNAADASPDLNALTEYDEPTPRPQQQQFPTVAYGRENLVDDFPSRPSTDSEERPFEHWYRGEVSRNGGVGELRVGRRMEMLEIANYGHNARSRAAMVNAATDWAAGGSKRSSMRRRAGSIGPGTRESFYMDDEMARGERVLDEAPPSDVDGGEDTDGEAFPSYADQYSLPPRSASALGIGDNRSLTPSSHMRERSTSRTTQKELPPSRIPTPSASRQISEPPRTPTPTAALSVSTSSVRSPATSSKTTRSPASTNSNQVPRSQSSPNTLTPANKRRAKSPAETSASAKKAKARTPPVSQVRQQENRRSIAEYPDPGDGDMSNAIPTWTQPVPPGGNWDDVVLPVVARKKGLDEHYTKADGSPKPRQNRNSVAPAPGTFGYDYSKYRPGQHQDIPMDEFGRPDQSVIDEVEYQNSTNTHQRAGRPEDPQDRMPIRPAGPPSPPPFSNYLPKRYDEGGLTVSESQLAMEHELAQKQQQMEDEATGAGCCKCVIM